MSPSKVEGGGEGLGMYFASLNFKYSHFRFLGGVDHFPVGIHSILCHLLSFYAVLFQSHVTCRNFTQTGEDLTYCLLLE